MRASSDKFNHLFVICCYLRVVSDAVLNPEAKSYDEFWNVAPTMLNDVVMSIIKNLE